ncbi:MAG TPA: condensation domain-containing protein, partial [Anaerolineae bacterium]
MNVVEFLATLSEQRVSVWTEGDRLRYRAPEGVLTPVLLEQLKQHKADIVAWLHERDSNTALLSFGQRALWFLYQLAPQSPAYNLMHAARLPSDLDAGVLRQAVGQLIDRHPVLRTTFTVMSGEPIQQIHNDPPEGYFEVIDAAGWHHEEINTRLEMMADRPFDLEQGPVMRLQLFENAPAANGQGQSYILLLTVHHIAVDFISLQVLLYELMTLYQAIKAGTPPSLPDLTSEYRDYVRWERDKLRADGDTLANYWHNQLGHAGSGKAPLPSLNLPTDYPRPALQTYAGDSYTFELDTILAQRLSDLAKANGTTLYTTLLAAFQIFLYRYTGQDDIPIGTPMDTRSLSQFERVVGYFANPVVLRADLSKNPTFTQHLKQVRQTVIEAVKHRDYPFPLLVDQLQQARDPGRSPLFQVAFAWDQFLPQELTPAGLPVETLAFGQRGSEFDLTLTILNMGGSLKGNLRFNLDLFEPATIQRMVGHLQTLLGGIVAYPEACIAALPLLTEAERHRLLFEWNDTGTDYPSDQCIQQLFETHVERTPQAVAVVYG